MAAVSVPFILPSVSCTSCTPCLPTEGEVATLKLLKLGKHNGANVYRFRHGFEQLLLPRVPPLSALRPSTAHSVSVQLLKPGQVQTRPRWTSVTSRVPRIQRYQAYITIMRTCIPLVQKNMPVIS